MKKIWTIVLSTVLVFSVAACGNKNSDNVSDSTSAEPPSVIESETTKESSSSIEEITASVEEPTESESGKTLVVYFSATGNTEEVANLIVAATDSDIFELEPVEPYAIDDLDYNDDDSRVVYEHEHPEERNIELVKATVDRWEEYDTVFIGYPIWWHAAAWPVDTFIYANDFTSKTVIPFCTSASSGLEDSGKLLEEMAGTGEWLEGRRFSSSVSENDVQEWIDGLGLQHLELGGNFDE